MLVTPHFINRFEAGRRLASAPALRRYRADPNAIVLALPRGGVPVAFNVAAELELPLDVCIVRKIGLPWNEELAMGAIMSGGVSVMNTNFIRSLDIPEFLVQEIIDREQEELGRREIAYRDDLPFPDLRGKNVILVDDGIATGASMRVAVEGIRQLQPRSITVATPVASREAMHALQDVADSCVALIAPEPFYGVGPWYRDFSQTSDDEVRVLLAGAREIQNKIPPAFAEVAGS